jgi:hypothetical protein
MQFYRFLQTPPDATLAGAAYVNTRTQWNTDIHLMCTYAFLPEAERRYFASVSHSYLYKQVAQTIFYNVTGSNRVELNSLGLVAGWLFYFQRSDANLRNQWSNYTNWPYAYLPNNVAPAPTAGDVVVYRTDSAGAPVPVSIGPGVDPSGNPTGLFITPAANRDNIKNILTSMGILLNGSYREDVLPVETYMWATKYACAEGHAPNGLYVYQFAMRASNSDPQPTGAIAMNAFSQVELQFNTIAPNRDPLAQSINVCDPSSGEVVGVNKANWRLYEYTFNLIVMEERYNVLTIANGECGLTFAT